MDQLANQRATEEETKPRGEARPGTGTRDADATSYAAASSAEERFPYRSFWDLPPLAHVCGAIIFLLGLAALVMMLFRVQQNGLLWLFFYSIPANTAISVFPHEPAIVYCGQHFNGIVIALLATAGNLVAAWIDYHFFTPLLQMQFFSRARKGRIYRKSVAWFAKAPFWVVALFALTPLPFYVVKFLAFAMGYPMTRYLAGIFVGRMPRFYLLALLGYSLKVPTSVMIIFFSVVFLVYLFFIAKRWISSRLTQGRSSAKE